MSSTISFCCGSGNIETVLLDEKNKSDIDRLTSMHFLCKPRRPQPHNLSPADVSLFPLLVSQQWNDYQQGNPHSKPKYDTKKPLQVEQPEQPEQPEVSKRSRRPTSLRPSSRKEKPAIPRLSFSANKDIAMAWMQMGRIKPLKTSTRHNPNTRVQAMAASQKIRHSFRSSSDETCVESVPISRSVIRHAGSKPVYQDSTPKNKRTGPSGRYIRPPPPPPQVSHCRRFRVCFGVMSDWKSAVDPKSGRTYYFNAVTKETQWRKPMELASDEERAEMEAKEKKQKDFFASMEANIIRSMAEGTVMTPKVQPMKQEPSVQPLRRPQVVRTISSMDEGILKDLVKRTPSITRTTGVTRVGSTIRSSALEKIQENSKEFDQSSFDYGNASMAFDGDASSANFGVSLEEIEALQELAKISKEMATVSDNTGMEMSSSEGFDMSFADFNISLSDDLNFSADSLNRSETKTSKEAPFGGLLFSPDFDEKKTAPSSASMAEIVFTPDVPVNKEPVVPSFGKAPAAAVIEEEEGLDLRSELKSKPVKFAAPKPAKPNKLTRRNTCGTIYVGTTMSAPDKDATMKCIAGVYRAHIIGAEREGEEHGTSYDSTKDRFRLFNDRDSQRKAIAPVEEEMCLDELDLDEVEREVPTLEVITSFYRDVFTRAQMETDCIIMSLIYVERLIKVTDGHLRPRRSNWRSLLFSCMILSSKVWDDLSMWNADFSQACPSGVHFSLKRINELELANLKALKYKVKVPASEYAKYYFLLRSMLIKSGLGGDDLKTNNPLDVEGAKRLEQVSSNFQNVAATKRRTTQENKLRSKSMGAADKDRMKGGASLEHLMQM